MTTASFAAPAATPARHPRFAPAGWQRKAANLWFDIRRTIGISGLVGIAGLVAAFVCWCIWVHGSDASLKQLRQEVRAAREQARRRPVAAPPPTTDEQLRAFVGRFPPRTQIGAALDNFSRLATAHQLLLPTGDYKFTESKNLHVSRYELHFPVRGSYAQVYGLIAAALNAMPNLSLDEIAIKRESRQATEIEAQLRFSLYLKQE
ncbi:MAG TPA: hypothetical protein VGN52_13985 [Burkholderiales bacterium]|jgi:hypothetical protein